jgi:hypothetical protein
MRSAPYIRISIPEATIEGLTPRRSRRGKTLVIGDCSGRVAGGGGWAAACTPHPLAARRCQPLTNPHGHLNSHGNRGFFFGRSRR